MGSLFLWSSAFIFGAVDGFSKMLAPTQSVAQIVWARYALALPVLLGSTTSVRMAESLSHQPAVAADTPRPDAADDQRHHGPRRALSCRLPTPPSSSSPDRFLWWRLSAPLLKERVSAASWIGVIVGFMAVLIVARPGFERALEIRDLSADRGGLLRSAAAHHSPPRRRRRKSNDDARVDASGRRDCGNPGRHRHLGSSRAIGVAADDRARHGVRLRAASYGRALIRMLRRASLRLSTTCRSSPPSFLELSCSVTSPMSGRLSGSS